RLGCAAHAVANGRQALAALAEAPYDILLLDCQMPELDGYETARLIRQRETPTATPTGNLSTPLHIIAMTANAMQGDRERCLATGMDDYIAKPVRLADLAAAVERARRFLPQLTPRPTSPTALPTRTTATASLDLSAVRALCGPAATGESDSLAELIELYLRDAQAQCDQMERGLAEGKAQVVQAAAHSLKGSSSNLGALPLAGCCAELEQRAKAGRLTDCPAILDKVRAEFARVTSDLQAELRQS
ncbi:MAG: response regulator, partial [Verrucomicrobia bacterium]|nr:response regulator [Verrucomicrobiota bacterium]